PQGGKVVDVDHHRLTLEASIEPVLAESQCAAAAFPLDQLDDGFLVLILGRHLVDDAPLPPGHRDRARHLAFHPPIMPDVVGDPPTYDDINWSMKPWPAGGWPAGRGRRMRWRWRRR